jgi:hypothetical protein
MTPRENGLEQSISLGIQMSRGPGAREALFLADLLRDAPCVLFHPRVPKAKLTAH